MPIRRPTSLRLTLGEAGFDRLAAMLDATFARKGRDGGVEEMGRGLYGHSLFYRAVGDLQRAARLQSLDRRPARRGGRADRAGAGHHAARLAMGFDVARGRGAAAAVRLRCQPGRPESHGESETDARLLELRPHPPADRRPREAGRHRSRHPDPAAAADVPAHAGQPGIPGLRAVARVLHRAEGEGRLPVRGGAGGAVEDLPPLLHLCAQGRGHREAGRSARQARRHLAIFLHRALLHARHAAARLRHQVGGHALVHGRAEHLRGAAADPARSAQR